MKPEQLIAAVLAAPADRHDSILKATRGTTTARKPEPINAREAASLLGCCVGTLRRMQKRGLITPRRLSKRLLRYERSEILALLEAPANVKEMEV